MPTKCQQLPGSQLDCPFADTFKRCDLFPVPLIAGSELNLTLWFMDYWVRVSTSWVSLKPTGSTIISNMQVAFFCHLKHAATFIPKQLVCRACKTCTKQTHLESCPLRELLESKCICAAHFPHAVFHLNKLV